MAFTKRFFLLSMFLLISRVGVQAQSVKYLFLKTSPLTLFEPRIPSFSLGAEFRFNRIGMHVEYGIPINEFVFNWNESITNVSYHKFRTEIKYYMGRIKDGKYDYVFDSDPKPYLSVEYFYVPRSYTRHNGLYSTGGKTYEYQTANIERSVWGVCGKFGIVHQITGSFYYEAFAGIGFRNVNTKYHTTNAVELNSEFEWGRHSDAEEGEVIKPHLSLGIKLGFLIPLTKERD